MSGRPVRPARPGHSRLRSGWLRLGLPAERPHYVAERDWAVLTLHVHQGLSFPAIARRLGLSPTRARLIAYRVGYDAVARARGDDHAVAPGLALR